MLRFVRWPALALVLGLAIGLAAAFGQAARAQEAPDPRVADLVRTGRLRAGLGVVAPHWAVRDQARGELRGVAVEVARALAARLRVALVAVEYPSPTRVLDGAGTGAWDVGFLGLDPSRAVLIDFSPPYLEVDSTFLVPAGSRVRGLADVDQRGLRVALSGRSVEDIVLSRTLRQVEFVRAGTIGAAFDLLRAGNADLLATPRPTAIIFSGRLPGSRVLDERFAVVASAIAVAKTRPDLLAYVGEFVEQAKASGLVQRAIESVGVRGVQVAPPGPARAN